MAVVKQEINYRASVLTLLSDQRPFRFHMIEDAVLVVGADGKIKSLDKFTEASFGQKQLVDLRPAWIFPGFIDSHIHFCQLDLIGCYAGELLQWLDQHTFPHEQRLLEDPSLVAETARVFVDQLLKNGTTTACIYGPSKKEATEQLFQELHVRGVRGILGKTSMDRNAPQGLLDQVEQDLLAHEDLARKWHGLDDRLFYSLTPRFAPSCSDALMQGLGELKRKHPDFYLQTHYAENLDELRWIRELYPNQQDYLAVYESFGLVDSRTILGHGIHVSAREYQVLHDTKAMISHCPSSNMFLGSGLCPVVDYLDRGLRLSLGTDVGAGTSFSLWRTMADAYKVAKLRGESLDPETLLALTTILPAEALGLADRIGSLSPGLEADFQVIDPRGNQLLERRLQLAADVEQKFFAFLFHADESCVAATYVRGKPLHSK